MKFSVTDRMFSRIRKLQIPEMIFVRSHRGRRKALRDFNFEMSPPPGVLSHIYR